MAGLQDKTILAGATAAKILIIGAAAIVPALLLDTGASAGDDSSEISVEVPS
ncbi:MAG: hypothetical protein J4F28_01165 [Nitrosopumilaceae archaeon]|nr:hypothetical protein [Nitrosopumilaceae archaeon]